MKLLQKIWLGSLLLIFSSCATYYQKNYDLMQAIYNGNIDNAEQMLTDKKWQKPNRNILLYYLNKGTVLSLNGKFSESNQYFQKADYYIEDFRKNYARSFVGLLTNPGYTSYAGESFEQILLHYYTSINYLQMGNYESALVECKRMQLKMQKITDQYGGKNKYSKDAFCLNLMGMVYEGLKDYNNAFISYKNAYEIYKVDYVGLDTKIPIQLKKDILRTAYLTGFNDQVEYYQKEFEMNLEIPDKGKGSLVFFWNNGLGPVKDQNSITFTIMPMGSGMVNFVNPELGMQFQFYVGDDDKKSLTALRIVRVAFPKYVSRVPYYANASILDTAGIVGQFEKAEDINAIAYKSLDDRMAKEIGEALLRVALKQAAEQLARKENQGAGMLLGLVNAFTEQADTRNWQLLPYSINYTRIELPEGENKIDLSLKTNKGLENKIPFCFNIKKGNVLYHSLNTLEFNGYSDRSGNLINFSQW